jgi:hypothetical protein
MEWWETSEEVVPAAPAPLARSRADRIAQVEEEVHAEAATIIRDALCFMKVDPDTVEPPETWVKELGAEGAMQRLRTAQMANLSPKEAPIGLRLAKDTLVGMSKAKAASKKPATTLNMVVVNMAGPLPQYPRREVLK